MKSLRLGADGYKKRYTPDVSTETEVNTMATIIKTDAGTYKAIARNSGDPWQVKLSRRKAMSSAQEHLLLVCLRYFRTDVECY